MIHGQNEDSLKIISKEIHKKIFKIDTHTDTPLWFNDSSFNFTVNNKTIKKQSHFDLPRMIEGNLNAVFFAAFVGQGNRDSISNMKVKQKVEKIINDIRNVIKQNNEYLELALSSNDALKLFNKGKKAIYIGIENGYAIGNDVNLIKYFYEMGVRYITLCHTKNNDICDSSTDPNGEEHKGLSEFGKQVIKEMNKLGMIIDISHVSDKTVLDVLKYSSAPVIASHSCAYSVCNNPRNISDDLLLKIKNSGGLVQVCLYSGYIKNPEPNPERDSALAEVQKKYNNFKNLPDSVLHIARAEWYEVNEQFPPKLATIQELVNHIDHIVKLIGVDYVGIGSDFDGGGAVIDCMDVSEIENITYELVKRGYKEDEIIKIWGANFLRVFKQIEETSNKLN